MWLVVGVFSFAPSCRKRNLGGSCDVFVPQTLGEVVVCLNPPPFVSESGCEVVDSMVACDRSDGLSIDRSRGGGVVVLKLSRPKARNCINDRLYSALANAIDDAGEDRDVTCVVLTGEDVVWQCGVGYSLTYLGEMCLFRFWPWERRRRIFLQWGRCGGCFQIGG